MATTWTPVSESSGVTRVADDILNRDESASPLIRRGRLIYSGDAINGFPGVWQHSTGLQFRPAPAVSRHPAGIRYTGVGAESSGQGSKDSGSGFYLRLDRVQEDAWYTFSGRFSIAAEVPGAVDRVTFYNDTQMADNSERCYPRAQWISATGGAGNGTGDWRIGGNAAGPGYTEHSYISIPGADRFPGDNENKYDSTYFAMSFFHAKSMPESEYGHFQIGGQAHDLRGLGGGYAKHATQVGDVPFQVGLNFGMSLTNPIAGKWGGIILHRLEVTVGDQLTQA